ncbi:hypothetical protein AB0J28_18615, partial [Streptosporangium canum]
GPYGPMYVYQNAFDSCLNIGSTAARAVGTRLATPRTIPAHQAIPRTAPDPPHHAALLRPVSPIGSRAVT